MNIDHHTGKENPLSYIDSQEESNKITPESKSLVPRHLNTSEISKIAHHLIIGKHGSGKSWIVRNIIYDLWIKEKIDSCIVLSSTNKTKKFYDDFIPKENIFYENASDVIKNIFQKQIAKIENWKNEHVSQNDQRSLCVILDDCLSTDNWFNDKYLYEFLFNARHYGITYLLTMEFPVKIKPELRNNFDYVFLAADDSLSNQKRIYDYYAGIYPNFNSFRQEYMQCTKNYGNLCIINGMIGANGYENNYENKIKYFKASNPDLFNVDCVYFTETDAECSLFKDDKQDEKKNLIKILSLIVETNNQIADFMKTLLDKL
jgi:hypothetical protein